MKWMRCLCLLLVMLWCVSASAEDYVISIDTTQTLQTDFQGFGIEWDPHAESMVLDSAWETLTSRVDFLSPQLVRCMVLARWYISGVQDGQPKLDFDNYEMRQAMRVLDYCQTHDIKVVWGDWGPPTNLGMAFDDAAWARGMAQCIDYLRRECGYTCIRYVNIGNEVDGDWSDCGRFPLYQTAVQTLYQEMEALGLTDEVVISGPDVYGNWNWLDDALAELDAELGHFDIHWYPDALNVMTGNLEIRLRRKLAQVAEQMGNRGLFVCELGLVDGKTDMDQQPNVREYWYGVSMTDAVIQLVRGGASGVIAWDLEDSMHPTGREYKTWGFYNMKGGEEEQELRPWFYPYSLLCRLFPQGCDILSTECSAPFGIRVLAMRDTDGNMSMAVVNDSGEAVEFTLTTDAAFPVLYQYTYLEDDRPVDALGFPVPSATLENTDLSQGILLTMPSDGVIFLTTIH